jgi:hypothetical protein
VGGASAVLRGYYLATPLFIAADAIWGANLRIAGLQGHPELKAAYYALCLGCGAIAWLRAPWTVWVGLLESSTNLLVLILSVFLPYYALATAVLDGTAAENPMTLSLVTNFLISGGAWTAAFYAHLPLGYAPGSS